MEVTIERLLLLDAKDYDDDMDVWARIAVRGIVFIGDKLLLLNDNKGEVSLPDGGQDEGESDAATHIREIREETGYSVIPDTIRPFEYIKEKRRDFKSYHDDRIFHQISRLYFCEVSAECGETQLSKQEKIYGMRTAMYTLDEAIAKNRAMLDTVGNLAWNQREYRSLLLIKEYIEKV